MMLFLAALLCANIVSVQGGVITQGQMNGNMISMFKSSLAEAEKDRKNARGRYCDDDNVKKELVCIMIECDYCKKWRNMNDAMERYNCPQPVGIKGDRTIAPTIIFETQMQAGSGGTSIPVCKVSLEDKSLFKDTCGKILKKSSLPKKTSGWLIKSETINCNVMNFEPVTTALLGANLAVIQVQTNQAMQAYGLVQVTSTATATATAAANAHAVQTVQAVPQPVQVMGTGTTSAQAHSAVATSAASTTQSVNLAADLALQSKLAADFSEKTQIFAQASAAFQAAQSKANLAQASATQAAAAKATAEQAAAAAATAVTVATNQLAQLEQAILTARKAVANAGPAKSAADARLKAATDAQIAADKALAIAMADTKSLGHASAVAKVQLNVATETQAQMSGNVAAGVSTSASSFASASASASASVSGGGGGVPVLLVLGQGGVVQDGAETEHVEENSEEGAVKKTKSHGKYKAPWFSLTAGTLHYWIVIILFTGAVMMYFVFGS